MSVEGAASQVLDAETRDIAIPDLAARVALGTPRVFRARTVRELQQAKDDPQAMPVAAREFSRTDRLLIRVPAYGPGTTPPVLTARLLNRAGQPMVDLAVSPAVGSSADQQVDLSLAGLAAGEYLVEVKTMGQDGEIRELVGFRVTS